MRVEQIPEGGRHFDIFDGDKIDEMLLVCKLLPDAEDDSQLLRELIKKAREIVSAVEQ